MKYFLFLFVFSGTTTAQRIIESVGYNVGQVKTSTDQGELKGIGHSVSSQTILETDVELFDDIAGIEHNLGAYIGFERLFSKEELENISAAIGIGAIDERGSKTLVGLSVGRNTGKQDKKIGLGLEVIKDVRIINFRDGKGGINVQGRADWNFSNKNRFFGGGLVLEI